MRSALPAIAVENLEVRFDGTVALTALNLCVEQGTSLAVIGRNGSGKSTLLRVLAGTVEPSTGSVQVDECAFVLQSTDVDRSLPITVRETVALARYPLRGLLRRLSQSDRRAVDRALERMDVADLHNQQLHDLSGGQRQRVLVAQGLAQEADVLLLDEPVTGLDVVSRAIILDVIDEELDAGRTVVTTTHDLADARRCTSTLLLNRHPIAHGPPEVVLTPDHLGEAFGTHFFATDAGVVLDDPHHDHHPST